MMTVTKIKIGTKFYAPHKDGNVEFTVIQQSGYNKGGKLHKVWIAEAQNDADWKGEQRAFTTEEIQHSLTMRNLFERLDRQHDAYYKSLKPGQIVHYNNGFGNFVRSEVTADRKLMPIALVGPWAKHDLPMRRIDGDVYYPYHALKIKECETFEPNASNIYENSTSLQNQYTDPAQLEPIDLSVPSMTPEQEEVAQLEQMVNTIHNLILDRSKYGGTRKDAKTLLAEIQQILNTNSIGE